MSTRAPQINPAHLELRSKDPRGGQLKPRAIMGFDLFGQPGTAGLVDIAPQ